MAKIFVCGDIVNMSGNNSFISERLGDEIKNADYAVCNFEGPELTNGQSCSNPHQEPGTAFYLKNKGFDLVLLANNHITDLGLEGVKQSLDIIEEIGLEHIGAGLSWEEAYKPIKKNIDGQHFGFINVCEAQVGQFIERDQPYGYAWMGYEGLFEDIIKLKKNNDYVIVFIHAGLEHYDIPLPEIRMLYQRLCDAGASAVIGSHPHCAQGYEYYGNSVIIYSLGNFYFPQRRQWPKENHSYSVILDFNRDDNIKVKPIYHYNNGLKVEIEVDNPILDIHTLNAKLGEQYSSLANEVVKEAYENLCNSLLIQSTCGQDVNDNWRAILRKTIDFTLYRKKKVYETNNRRSALLLRLFENETYRWVIIRYLKINTQL